MLRTRVIPCLLLDDSGLVKTRKFTDPVYIGDPINAVRIFNEKEVDEMIFLDISATRRGQGPDFSVIADIAGEAFMPFGYGGGITELEQIRQLVSSGVEKVVLNTSAVEHPELVTKAADEIGSQSVIVSIDCKRTLIGGYQVMTYGGRKSTGLDPARHAMTMEQAGAGEIVLTSIDREGMGNGFDLELICRVSSQVGIPVVAHGGAGTLEHLRDSVVVGGAAAVAAGSMFCFQGRHRAVLITYPDYVELEQLFEQTREQLP